MLIEVLRALGGFVDPSAVLVIAVLASAIAMIIRYRRLAMFTQGIAVAIVVLFGILPGGTMLALPLEKRFPANPPLPNAIAGIIALGGTERLSQSEAWGQPTLSDPTPIAALIALGRRYPEAKLVFSGGAAARDLPALTESKIVSDFLEELGAGGSRILYEDRSQNTFENAAFSRDLVRPRPEENWILITEAISMPRAVAVFRHAGWNVIAFPAGYLTNGEATVGIHLLKELSLASMALHEWGGLIVYRLMGYTDGFLPL